MRDASLSVCRWACGVITLCAIVVHSLSHWQSASEAARRASVVSEAGALAAASDTRTEARSLRAPCAVS